MKTTAPNVQNTISPAAKGGNEILTIKEVSDVSGMSVYAIRTGIKNGIFPAFRVSGNGGKWLMNLNEFQDAIRNLGKQNMNQSNDTQSTTNGIRRIAE